MTVLDFGKKKRDGVAISMVTSYDSWSASLIAMSDVDCILVGDSAAMVMHGHRSTVPITSEVMAIHAAAVRRGAPDAFIVGDMPFLSVRMGLKDSMKNAALIMQSGANAIKIEGADGNKDFLDRCADAGVPVMGHLGLIPQSVNKFGGYRVQGRGEEAAEKLLDDAKSLQRAGCFALVLEAVPRELAARVSATLDIPTIGVGAGDGVDGQVLVLQDLLGLTSEFKPKFVRNFMDGAALVKAALNDYHREVREGTFPGRKEWYE